MPVSNYNHFILHYYTLVKQVNRSPVKISTPCFLPFTESFKSFAKKPC